MIAVKTLSTEHRVNKTAEKEHVINLGYKGLDEDMKSILQKRPGHTIYKQIK